MAGIRLAASNIGWDKADDARVLGHMKQLGYAGLEIAPTRIFPEAPYERLPAAALYTGYLYREYGLVVASMQSILAGRAENLFDAAGAYALTEYIDAACAFAQSCRCRNLVFGCPRNRQLPDGAPVTAADDFFRENALLAARRGVTLALETVPPCYGTTFLNRTPATLAYVRRLGVPGLSVNLDVGAMLTNGENVRTVLADLALVSHVHISEPGLAPIAPHPLHRELALLLKGLGYQGFVSVEMKRTDADTMCAALEYVAEVFA